MKQLCIMVLLMALPEIVAAQYPAYTIKPRKILFCEHENVVMRKSRNVRNNYGILEDEYQCFNGHSKWVPREKEEEKEKEKEEIVTSPQLEPAKKIEWLGEPTIRPQAYPANPTCQIDDSIAYYIGVVTDRSGKILKAYKCLLFQHVFYQLD